MTFDPARQQYLYASGENGVHKSTDGGSTWRTVNSGLPRQWYQYLMIDPQNNSRLYVLGGKKLYRSDNEGESWRALPTPRQDLRATLLAVDSLGSVYISRIKVGLPNGASILSKSTDQGRSWSTVQEFNNGKYGYIFKLQFDPSDAHTLYVLSQDEGIWVSGDDGRTWGMFDHSRSNSWSKPRDMQARPWGNGDFLIATSEGVSAYSVNVTAGAPEIEALSSAAVKPGESIVISGRNFGSVPGLVQIEGVAAGVRSWSANRIEITAPSNFETGTIRVTTSSGTASNPNLVVRLPDAGRVDPTTGPASGGTRVFLYCPGPYGIYLPLMFGDGLLHQVQFITDDVLSGITPPGTGTVSVRDFCSGSATFTYQ